MPCTLLLQKFLLSLTETCLTLVKGQLLDLQALFLKQNLFMKHGNVMCSASHLDLTDLE